MIYTYTHLRNQHLHREHTSTPEADPVLPSSYHTPCPLYMGLIIFELKGFFFFFLRWSFVLVARAVVQWCNLGSLQPPPPEFK